MAKYNPDLRDSSELPLPEIYPGDSPPQVVLGEPQRLALEWLMNGGTVTEASQYAGVCRQTVSEWLHHDEDFRQIFRQWQEQVRCMNHARLLALSETALDTIADSVRDKRDPKVAIAVLKGLGMLGPTK